MRPKSRSKQKKISARTRALSRIGSVREAKAYVLVARPAKGRSAKIVSAWRRDVEKAKLIRFEDRYTKEWLEAVQLVADTTTSGQVVSVNYSSVGNACLALPADQGYITYVSVPTSTNITINNTSNVTVTGGQGVTINNQGNGTVNVTINQGTYPVASTGKGHTDWGNVAEWVAVGVTIVGIIVAIMLAPAGAYNEPKLPKRRLSRDMLAMLPVISNFSAVWRFDSLKARVSEQGGAYGLLGLASAVTGCGLGFGLMKMRNASWAVVGIYKEPKETPRVTNLLALPKAESYCFEIDLDPATGRTKLWVNDVGLDMGTLKGFIGGAHVTGLVSGGMRMADHLPAGSYSDVAVVSDGKWKAVKLSEKDLIFTAPLVHDTKITAAGGLAMRDFRSAVV